MSVAYDDIILFDVTDKSDGSVGESAGGVALAALPPPPPPEHPAK